jgi:hypothetical protein
VLADRVHGELQRLAGAVGQRQLVVLAVVADLLAAQRHLHDVAVLAGAGQRLVEADAVPALRHLRPGDAEPEPEPPAGQVSRVAAVMAQLAGVRPGIWKMAEPMSMRSVCAATKASTVGASEP